MLLKLVGACRDLAPGVPAGWSGLDGDGDDLGAGAMEAGDADRARREVGQSELDVSGRSRSGRDGQRNQPLITRNGVN
jgi:hypothetical protein